MFYIIAACLLYTASLMFGTFANRNANVSLVAAVINICSALIPIAVVATAFSDKWEASSSKGLMAAVVSGSLVALFVMSLGKAYSQENVAIVSPIVFGGAIALTSILSFFIFKEKIAPLQGFGLALVLAGIGLIITAKLRTT